MTRTRYRATLSSTPDPWGGRATVFAVTPRGLRDALRVLCGRYDALVWVERDPAGTYAVYKPTWEIPENAEGDTP